MGDFAQYSSLQYSLQSQRERDSIKGLQYDNQAKNLYTKQNRQSLVESQGTGKLPVNNQAQVLAAATARVVPISFSGRSTFVDTKTQSTQQMPQNLNTASNKRLKKNIIKQRASKNSYALQGSAIAPQRKSNAP